MAPSDMLGPTWRLRFCAAAALLVAACGGRTDPAWPEIGREALMSCGADRAQWAVGERYNQRLVNRVRQHSGTTVIRSMLPDDTGTMDHNAERLNLRVGSNGTVQRVSCG